MSDLLHFPHVHPCYIYYLCPANDVAMTLVVLDFDSSDCVWNSSLDGCGLGIFGNCGDNFCFDFINGFSTFIPGGFSVLDGWHSALVMEVKMFLY